MNTYHNDGQVRIIQGNALDVLAEIPAESVQCVVTSPPYWGLRVYAGEQGFVWGNGHCEHEWGEDLLADTRDESFKGWGNAVRDGQALPAAPHIKVSQGSVCTVCGCWRGAYGLEPTVEMYVEHTVEILREIRRVLRPDGVVFWNIGDSYTSGNRQGHGTRTGYKQETNRGTPKDAWRPPMSGTLKEKDLCLVPARVALAAQADGWWVRSDIIWAKQNFMPESVTDRPTKSHEYIFMLTKSARYYYDAEAVREPMEEYERQRRLREKQQGLDTVFRIRADGQTGQHEAGTTGVVRTAQARQDLAVSGRRNARTVWEFPTQPCPDAHFAVFPEGLPERCIQAATSEKGNCSACGLPWERVMDRRQVADPASHKGSTFHQGKTAGHQQHRAETAERWETLGTIGWKPQCSCGADPEPALVLDPFSGSGTTLWVAKRLGRHAIGIDTAGEYCGLALDRCRQMALAFA